MLQALRVQRTSNKIASKFHNIQKLYLGYVIIFCLLMLSMLCSLDMAIRNFLVLNLTWFQVESTLYLCSFVSRFIQLCTLYKVPHYDLSFLCNRSLKFVNHMCTFWLSASIKIKLDIYYKLLKPVVYKNAADTSRKNHCILLFRL